jgi:pimeloyl-ACP methyl ester carboxylesterase
VTHGDADRRVPLSIVRELVRRLPDARLYVFRDRGHIAIYTAPAEFCDVVRRFVRTGGRPDAGDEAISARWKVPPP